jgi:hypothetical protein
MFKFPTPVFTPGEAVLVRSGFVPQQAIVEAQNGTNVTVAYAPDGNRTVERSQRDGWERGVVDAGKLRRYEW